MLAVNHTIESVTGEVPFDQPSRVFWVNRSMNLVGLIKLEKTLRAPWFECLNDLEVELAAGRLRFTKVRLPYSMLVAETDLTEAKKDLRKKCWDIVSPIIDELDDQLRVGGTIGSLVSARAKGTGKHRFVIYRYLYRYWAYGSTPNAFLDRYANSGAAGMSKSYQSGVVAGRPRKHLGETPADGAKMLTEIDKEMIKIGYALYRDNKVKHQSDAYIKMLRRFYRAEHPSPDGSDDERPLRMLDEIPTLRQFSYWGKKFFDDMDVMRSRKGERRWALNHRELSGTARQGVRGPCHRFEIDATIADIYLVSRFNRSWVIGRPVVYVVVDVFSRMIVGVHVGLEGPSWNIARHAVFNAFTDKVAVCAAHGISIDSKAWPCHHLPHELVADRGEMLGQAAEGLVQGLKINLSILPPFRADWKGTVERTFRTLNNLTQIHWLPGAVRTREKERGQRDYRLDATLDMPEFTALIFKAVLYYNQHSRDPNRLSERMMEDGIDSTPLAIWNWASDRGLMEPNTRSREEIYLHLLPKAQATVRAGGIYFNGVPYKNMLDVSGKQSARARASGRQSITIWHEAYADHIWVQDPEGAFVQCPLRESETRLQDKRLEEVFDMLAITEAVAPESEYARLNGRVQLDEFIESTLATAKSKKKQISDTRSNAAKVGDIRNNRLVERDAVRVEAAQNSVLAVESTEKTILATPISGSAMEYAGERHVEVMSLLSRVSQRKSTK